MTHDDTRYTKATNATASAIIRSYSTSFYLSSLALGQPIRTHVHNLYGMVRIADEIVDGTANAAGIPTEHLPQLLNDYEARVHHALNHGFSTDPLIHAFATTARWAGFPTSHITDFFTSMRTDLSPARTHSPESAAAYVHGSAGVIGLMCNAIFAAHLRDAGTPWDDHTRRSTDHGAYALGSAFQKVNFLRDFGHDHLTLGRHYLPHVPAEGMNGEALGAVAEEIQQELATACATIPQLPRTARGGVLAAHDLFAELNRRLAATDPEELARTRVRIPETQKARIIARALWRARRM
ncbi:MAG TPA: squalene/phytoene synthase family protein [Candidatus Corynebacterium gallistercoris]|uniref:Squalene/phytoene synthase family protein n=1 Tax=Candidatus Corynebacterium gallistercoris TaxID=2838530 RepID=A0A9D1RXB7_9CORY|nr:squalene/phytoene synthase family protein [Candidatus Corynebacterium gallistercoris]